MANARRNTLAAVALVFSTIRPAGADPNGVIVHVSDYVTVPPVELRLAEAEAGRIFRAAGIAMIWASGGDTADSSGLHLNVFLLNREQSDQKITAERIAPNVLGQASRVTRRAYIFGQRVSEAAAENRQHLNVALGRVIAHEIGHMLLPTCGHSDFGIMSANLNMSNWPERFTKTEVRQLQAILAAEFARQDRASNTEDGSGTQRYSDANTCDRPVSRQPIAAKDR